MAVRPIDANAMLNELRPVSFEAEHSAVLLSDVSKMMREWVERQPTLTQPNEPMTLEQLREMDGEPVYDAKYKKWHVIETVGNCFVEMTDGAIFDSDIWCNNLTDRLYRRPPEGEEDT